MTVESNKIREENGLFYPPRELSEKAYVKDMEDYKRMYNASLEDREKFWGDAAREFLTWYKPWDNLVEEDFVNANISWFKGGKLNASYNCLDRHLDKRGDQVAIIWEGNEPTEHKTLTYKQIYDEVNRFANVLKKHGIKKGDRIILYMPMIPELAMAMLACARIGAIHSVVFGGFSADSLKDRIQDSEAVAVVTSDGSFRGKKAIPLKTNADEAITKCPSVKKVFVVNRTNLETAMNAGRDFWWHEEVAAPDVQELCEPEVMDSEDPLFTLYTSGSTGKPKGVLHTTGGYLLYTAMTHKYIFDYKDGEIFWCTADIGWVTGHSYIVYGPLINGATTIMFEGVPSYPDFSRFWAVVDKWKVNSFYTAPTAIRACMKEGEDWVNKCDLSTLRILGTVGEPINPEAWMWYHRIVGKERCPIMDTWWQTETGGHMITPLPGAVPTKPGSATLPFFGVKPVVLNEKGEELEGEVEGALCIKHSWPGMMRTVYGHHERFKEVYFSMFPGYYFSGDGCRRDEHGYYWITGRMDDVINVSGHRMGTAEVESALVSHPTVAEAAVVGYPHDIKGQGIYAYVILKTGETASDDLMKQLVGHVRKEIGPIATPDKIQFVDGLPKTRSGKIMRRILRKVASNEVDQIGDTSTLADPSVVTGIVGGRK